MRCSLGELASSSGCSKTRRLTRSDGAVWVDGLALLVAELSPDSLVAARAFLRGLSLSSSADDDDDVWLDESSGVGADGGDLDNLAVLPAAVRLSPTVGGESDALGGGDGEDDLEGVDVERFFLF